MATWSDDWLQQTLTAYRAKPFVRHFSCAPRRQQHDTCETSLNLVTPPVTGVHRFHTGTPGHRRSITLSGGVGGGAEHLRCKVACMYRYLWATGACKVRLSHVTRRAVNHWVAEGSDMMRSTMTRTTLFLATVALSASTALPRPALKPTLKLHGGELPPRPSLYGAPGDKSSRGLTFTCTTTGTTVELVVLGSGIVGLHAISFDRLIATPGPLRLVFFIGVIFFDSLWPQRTIGRLVVSAL